VVVLVMVLLVLLMLLLVLVVRHYIAAHCRSLARGARRAVSFGSADGGWGASRSSGYRTF
jgi:hypothetical protein